MQQSRQTANKLRVYGSLFTGGGIIGSKCNLFHNTTSAAIPVVTTLTSSSLTTTLPRGVYPLPHNRGTSGHQTHTSHCSRGRTWLGSCYSENEAIKRPRHRTHSTGCGNRAVTGVERYRRPQAQKVLGSVEVARCDILHTRAQLGIRQRTIYNSPISYPSEQS
jgi:hypothetical protein